MSCIFELSFAGGYGFQIKTFGVGGFSHPWVLGSHENRKTPTVFLLLKGKKSSAEWVRIMGSDPN